MSADVVAGPSDSSVDRFATAMYLLGMLLVGFAWILVTPVGSAPDEPAHMVKALALAHGQVSGVADGPPATYLSDPALTPRQRDLLRADTRFYAIDGRLVPTPPCFAARFTGRECDPVLVEATRLSPSYVGNFPPGGYISMAVGARLGWSAKSATLLARVANWLTCWGLLAFAVLALRHSARNPRVPLVALTLAMTPSVWFVTGTANPSGVEICAAITFSAGLLAMTRPQGMSRRWLVPVTSVAGALLASARPMSWMWLVLITVVILVARGNSLLRRVRKNLVWCSMPFVATAAALWWQTRYPSAGAHFPPLRFDTLSNTLRHLSQVGIATQYVGDFNWLSNPVPAAIVVSWLLLSVGFLLSAAIWGTRRLGLTTLAVSFFAAPLTVAYSALMLSSTGWNLAARYIFPATCSAFLLAGEAIDRRGASSRYWPTVVFVLATAMQSVALVVAADGPVSDRFHETPAPVVATTALFAVGWALQFATFWQPRRVERLDATALAATPICS